MSKETKTEMLMQELRKQYETAWSSGAPWIDPAYLADSALLSMDPTKDSPILVSWGCTLELRQLARQLCRRGARSMERQAEEGQPDMFSDLLQDMYPCARNGREVYVRRAAMTRDDYEINVARLSTEAVSKQRHSDALRAEMEMREARGDFEEPAVS